MKDNLWSVFTFHLDRASLDYGPVHADGNKFLTWVSMHIEAQKQVKWDRNWADLSCAQLF
jgi:hypothetical protein